MTERRPDPANLNLPRSAAGPSPVPIDVNNHLRARKAVRELLDRKKRIFVARRTVSQYGTLSRILLDGKYYDVNARQLEKIRAGARPEDVWGVEEVPDRFYGDDDEE